MAELSTLKIQRIYAKNDQEITLEEAEEVLNFLRMVAGIALSQVLQAEPEVLNQSPLALEERSHPKTDHKVY